MCIRDSRRAADRPPALRRRAARTRPEPPRRRTRRTRHSRRHPDRPGAGAGRRPGAALRPLPRRGARHRPRLPAGGGRRRPARTRPRRHLPRRPAARPLRRVDGPADARRPGAVQPRLPRVPACDGRLHRRLRPGRTGLPGPGAAPRRPAGRGVLHPRLRGRTAGEDRCPDSLRGRREGPRHPALPGAVHRVGALRRHRRPRGRPARRALLPQAPGR